MEIAKPQVEISPLDITVTASNSTEVQPIDNADLDITVTKKEYKIVGDEVYIAKLYDDAPQWMKDLVQLVVDNTVTESNLALLNDVIARLNTFATSYVPLNQYTQAILDLSNADSSMHALIETLNSNFNDGLDAANSQIINLEITKASKDEAIAAVLTTLAAQLSTPTSDLGAIIANLQQAITTGDSANASSIQTLTSSLEGEVDARATVVNSLTTAINNGDAAVQAKWAYNSTVAINGVYKKSGFGLTSNYSGGSGTENDPYVSEFWIDATKLKFTNSNATGSTAPFTIDASGATPQIMFNGKVSFSNVTNVPQLGSTPQQVVDAVNAGSTTTIDGAKITTGSIAADKITANSITGDQIEANISISSPTITGGVINGGTINGVNINGAVIKASWIDYNTTGILTNWAYYTVATMPPQYANNFAHDSLTGALLTDANGYVRLPKVGKVVIDAYSYKVGRAANVYNIGNLSFAGYSLNVRSYDNYTTTSTRRLLDSNSRIVFAPTGYIPADSIPFLQLTGGIGTVGGATGSCTAKWRIGTDAFSYYGYIANQGSSPKLCTTRLAKNGVYLFDVTGVIDTSLTYDADFVSSGITTHVHAIGTSLSVTIVNLAHNIVDYIGQDADIAIGPCSGYASEGINVGMSVVIPTGTETY